MPIDALAGESNVLSDDSVVYVKFLNKASTSIAVSDLTSGSYVTTYVEDRADARIGSGNLENYALSAKLYHANLSIADSIAAPTFVFRVNCQTLGITGNTVKVVAPNVVRKETSINGLLATGATYPIANVRCFTYSGELNITNGNVTIPTGASYLYILCRTSSAIADTNVVGFDTLPKILVDMSSSSTSTIVQNQTQQLMSTNGSDNVVTNVQNQYTQQVEGLPLFQFMEDTEEGWANSIQTTESDTVVPFPGISFQGFTLPAMNVDVMGYVPESLKTPIRMFLTFIFCSLFVNNLIDLSHAVFEIKDYSYSEYVVEAKNLSG